MSSAVARAACSGLESFPDTLSSQLRGKSMSFERHVPVLTRHLCTTPPHVGLGRGTRYRCECGRLWQRTDALLAGLFTLQSGWASPFAIYFERFIWAMVLAPVVFLVILFLGFMVSR